MRMCVCVWVIYYMTALTYQKPIRCSPKTNTIWSPSHYLQVKSPRNHHTITELLTFVNHTECHCIQRSSYGTEGVTTNLGVRQATIFNCNCPQYFEKILQNDGQCRCDCSSSNYDCDFRKRGSEHFSMVDRKWVTKKMPLKKIPPNSLSPSSSLPGAYSKGAASRRPASLGSTWRGRVVVPMRTIRCIINRIPTTHAVCRKHPASAAPSGHPHKY